MIVGVAAQQTHGDVVVGVHQTRHQYMVIQNGAALGPETTGRLVGGAHGQDFTVAHRDRAIVEGGFFGDDGDEPARVDEQIDVFRMHGDSLRWQVGSISENRRTLNERGFAAPSCGILRRLCRGR